MLVKTGQSVTTEFTTCVPTTGAASNADSLPTATLYVDGTANGATVTVTNVTTGIYKAAVTLPTLTAGQVVSIVVSATVSTVAGTAKVWEAVADTLRLSDTLTANPASGGIATASFASGATIPRVTLADTVTTYTGNTPQTGDAYARIGAAGAGLTAVGDTAGTTTLLSRLSATRAGYLDNLSAGAVALASALTTAQTDITTILGRVTAAVATAASLATAQTDLTTLTGRLTSGRATALDNLDATVSSRSTLTVAQVWDRLTSALTTTGSVGKLIVDYLDAAVSSRLSSSGTASVTITGPVLTSGDIVIVQGDDYSATDGRSLDWTYTDAAADYTSSTAQIVLDKSGTTKTFTMNAPSKSGSTVTLRWVPSATDTADTNLSAGVWTFQIHVTLSSGRKLTPVRGSAAVIDRIA